MSKQVISWWSGGITSAVTCHLCIDLFGLDNCRFIFIDTKNEHPDTYRFKKDCEEWYNKEIEVITGLGGKYKTIEDVWIRFKSMNVAHGAICSSELKRSVRQDFEKVNSYKHQAFGFEISENKRAMSLSMNYPSSKPIFPLLLYGYTKKNCIDLVLSKNIKVPKMYELGFNNNNCFGRSDTAIGGCVQGGIGYWQKMKREFRDKFDKMADMEHKLSELKGAPVTMLTERGDFGRRQLFLRANPKYPHIRDISVKKGREPEPLMECNGFCGTNDLEEPNPTQDEINYDQLELW